MEPDAATANVDMGKREREIANWLSAVLGDLGYNLEEENLVRTPIRVAKFLLSYRFPEIDDEEAIKEILHPTFIGGDGQLIIVKDISLTALCAHHMLPFTGTAAVGYIPSGKVVGISKLARIVKHFSQRLTLQEHITQQVADAIEDVLSPLGVMVVIQAEHQCMTIRGVEDPHAHTVTSIVRGVFDTNEKGSKEEFLQLIHG